MAASWGRPPICNQTLQVSSELIFAPLERSRREKDEDFDDFFFFLFGQNVDFSLQQASSKITEFSRKTLFGWFTRQHGLRRCSQGGGVSRDSGSRGAGRCVSGYAGCSVRWTRRGRAPCGRSRSGRSMRGRGASGGCSGVGRTCARSGGEVSSRRRRSRARASEGCCRPGAEEAAGCGRGREARQLADLVHAAALVEKVEGDTGAPCHS